MADEREGKGGDREETDQFDKVGGTRAELTEIGACRVRERDLDGVIATRETFLSTE